MGYKLKDSQKSRLLLYAVIGAVMLIHDLTHEASILRQLLA